jgi:ATP phosphoribosyltransferase-like protein
MRSRRRAVAKALADDAAKARSLRGRLPVDAHWVDLSTVVEERQVRELIPRLYEAGAPGIIEVPIAKIIE